MDSTPTERATATMDGEGDSGGGGARLDRSRSRQLPLRVAGSLIELTRSSAVRSVTPRGGTIRKWTIHDSLPASVTTPDDWMEIAAHFLSCH